MLKQIILSILVSVTIVGGTLWIISNNINDNNNDSANTNTDKISTTFDSEGNQIIDITAKGGYWPREIYAKANTPTILKVKTSGTWDCSASLVIPKLSYRNFLQPSGTEEIKIPAEKAVGTVQGLCSMGMYNFKVNFVP
ncbi:cupredoxin domain-containing protein [Candidatus Peregrinibacteria bacterium]|nr:cupredoxin domain-containing protein [Candidatus Peregrinibacteria bacterium]